MKDIYIPVKITDEEWADKLMAGDVFMRPLHEFGIWNTSKNDKLNNNYRGDNLEGATNLIKNLNEDDFLKGFSSDFKEVVKDAYYIDNGDAKYFKIFSLYCLEYDDTTNSFIKPDSKIKEFGDTAVVIRDYDTFIKRVLDKVMNQYKDFIFLIDRVTYYKNDKDASLNPLFNKNSYYGYQNELRMAVAESTLDLNNSSAEKNMRMICDLSSVHINIGDISDIAVKVPINEFLNLDFIDKYRLIFPMNNNNRSTILESIIKDTRMQMRDYLSPPDKEVVCVIY